MSELGLQLKQARDEKQLSLEDLQRITKIQKRYLLAIEEGRFDSLPGLFYARAFVKTYAEAVGIDSTEFLEQHKNELPQPSKNAENIPSRSERRKPIPEQPANRKSRVASVLPVIAVIVFLIVIAAAIWVFRGNFSSGDNAPIAPENTPTIDAEYGDEPEPEDEPAEDEAEDEQDSSDEGTSDTEDETEEDEPTSTLTFNESSGNTSSFDLEAPDFDVRVEFTGDCYADIKDADGEFLVPSTGFSDGNEISEDYSDQESILINLGASQNATVFINDEEVELPLDLVHQKLEITYNP